ncbi:MAG: hypothetical protein EZS28_017568 [Streblomastix strix]|uniref:RRM domain-containing protein n=1 Tax=Streblomastix strix TaxID=222440 RepID=A0A5J4VWE9_9EUKA|nr:MAG: hypothetical protein EZS28_017568 [Streblomastix strix]
MATSSRLFIGNLNYKTKAEIIGHLFETIGGVDSLDISCKNGRSLEYGFIEMADVESAERAHYINDCRSGIEKILLDIIELIVEHGIQKYDP